MKHIATAALAAFALISCQSEAHPPATLHPALWKVTDADTTVYLFGTIHVLPQTLKWTSPRIDSAIKGSQALVLETVLDKDPAVMQALMARIGMSPGLPPLLERVPPEKRPALQKLVTKVGVPLAVFDRLETWAAALTLASAGLRDLPVTPEYGAEAVLTRRFVGDKKPVSGLETPGEQLGYFDGLPESAQRKFLESVADDDGNALTEFNAMIAAWGAGDTRKIALTFDDELKLSPELTEVLLTRRNANWAHWIEARMTKPGTVFVAVGAGHLAGDGAVTALLTRAGLKVSRVQ